MKHGKQRRESKGDHCDDVRDQLAETQETRDRDQGENANASRRDPGLWRHHVSDLDLRMQWIENHPGKRRDRLEHDEGPLAPDQVGRRVVWQRQVARDEKQHQHDDEGQNPPGGAAQSVRGGTLPRPFEEEERGQQRSSHLLAAEADREESGHGKPSRAAFPIPQEQAEEDGRRGENVRAARDPRDAFRETRREAPERRGKGGGNSGSAESSRNREEQGDVEEMKREVRRVKARG